MPFSSLPWWLMLAFVAMLLYAAAPILYKLTPDLKPVQMIFVFSVSGVVIAGALMAINNEWQFSQSGLLWALGIGVLINLAFIVYLAAIQQGPVSVVALIRNLGIAVTFILAVVFLGESVTLLKLLGAGLAVVAVVLLSM